VTEKKSTKKTAKYKTLGQFILTTPHWRFITNRPNIFLTSWFRKIFSFLYKNNKKYLISYTAFKMKTNSTIKFHKSFKKFKRTLQ